MASNDNQLLDFLLLQEEISLGRISLKDTAPVYPNNMHKVLDRNDYETYVDVDFTVLEGEGYSVNGIPSFKPSNEANTILFLKNIMDTVINASIDISSLTESFGLSIVDIGTQLTVNGSAWSEYTYLPDYLKNTWGTTNINEGDIESITCDGPMRIWLLRALTWSPVHNINEYTLHEILPTIALNSAGHTVNHVYYKDVNAGTHTLDTLSGMYFFTSQDGTKTNVSYLSTPHPNK